MITVKKKNRKIRNSGFGKSTIIVVGLVLFVVIASIIIVKNKNNPNTASSTPSNSNQFPQAEYKDFVTKYSEKYPQLLKKNNQAYVSEFSGFVPTVLEERDDYVRVYSDMSQTVLNIPRGWFGFDTTKDGLFFDPDQNVILRIGFTDMGEDVTSIDQMEALESKTLNDINTLKSLPSGATTSVSRLNNDKIIVNLKLEQGESWTVYRLNYNKPRFAHKTQLNIRIKPAEKYLGLMGLLLRDVQIIGINPGDPPDAREKFLKTLPSFDSCYGIEKLGVKCNKML